MKWILSNAKPGHDIVIECRGKTLLFEISTIEFSDTGTHVVVKGKSAELHILNFEIPPPEDNN